MMELVDMRDLGSRAFRRWGSSPHARTKTKGHPKGCPFVLGTAEPKRQHPIYASLFPSASIKN